MIHKIVASQIPQFWDTIKFAVLNADNVAEKDRQLYLNQLLAHLLCDKAQCFVRSLNRELQALTITRIIKDEITGENSLIISSLFSFKVVPNSEWLSDIEAIRKFAKVNHCKKVVAVSNNPRVFEIANSIGFVERYRSFALEV
jgi:hypothetical protein